MDMILQEPTPFDEIIDVDSYNCEHIWELAYDENEILIPQTYICRVCGKVSPDDYVTPL